MTANSPTPPKSLSREGKALWRRLVDDYRIDDEGGLALVEVAAHAHARAHNARLQIERDGATITDRFGQLKAHPAVAIERDAMGLLVRTIRALELEVEEPGPREARAIKAKNAATGRFAPGAAPLAFLKGGAK